MEEFQLQKALGSYVIVEPAEKSSVLKAEEISTVFTVVSVGDRTEFSTLEELPNYLGVGDKIIVSANSVEKCMMGHKEVYYVRESDVIGKVTKSV